ncbi:nucleotidyltransferase domain-containing protein [Longimicrobium sp.]|uniref:nucleotidyltransferase domain-containing protein n=1 Tax=Longimicrobium sp. TaxID=2029185 RepID=UPI002BD94FA4|nr:nucleotidyltransferase domain-containing protein [Longimicrobium sp.]HSU15379.1 nucleotidyltransferase domain-containing protein [Longimicrobium sp.]
MSTVDAPPVEIRLPPIPRDAHTAAAEAMLRRLAAAFPDAGLGITGSLATGTHGPGSDIDLVMTDASFRREVQFASASEGIPVAVVCLRPRFDADRERRWMLQSGGDVRIVSMVRSAFVARDPGGSLAEMQRTVERLDAERRTRRDELVAVRREDAASLVRALRGGTPASDEHVQLQLFDAVVDGWYLKHGLAMDTRRESERMLETIAARDAALFELLRRAVPLTHTSMAPLLRAVDLVFG